MLSSMFPYDQLNEEAGLWYYYHKVLSINIGVVFYAARFVLIIRIAVEIVTHFSQAHCPESWKPGHFDIWGASHQIFHIGGGQRGYPSLWYLSCVSD